MEVAGARDSGDEKENGYPAIEGETDDFEQDCLAQRADKGEAISDKVELGDLAARQVRLGVCSATGMAHLAGLREQPARVADDGMEGYVQPAPDGKLRRVLPRLKAVSVGQVVRGLPVVERLIAVLDWRKQGGDDTSGQENVESRDGLNGVRALAPARRLALWFHNRPRRGPKK